uniref:Uncharacterized protein n=1 Tax=Arundo donax TaxID=35708 RepID=A0A0A9A820_ARUDO
MSVGWNSSTVLICCHMVLISKHIHWSYGYFRR